MKSADISPCKNVSFFCILKAPRSFFLVKMSYYSQRHVTYSNEILPSGHLVRKWRRINVDATWLRRIDVDTTSFWHQMPAG